MKWSFQCTIRSFHGMIRLFQDMRQIIITFQTLVLYLYKGCMMCNHLYLLLRMNLQSPAKFLQLFLLSFSFGLHCNEHLLIAQDCLYLLKIQFYQNIDKQYGIFGNILKSHGLCYRYAFRASHDRIDIKI